MRCTTEKYDLLYARWLEKPGALLDWGCYDSSVHRNVIDLCGGTGAVSLEMLKRGAKEVWLIDLNPRCSHPDVRCYRADVNKRLSWFPSWSYDMVVCRQAIGYLRLDQLCESLSFLLKPGGVFLFNAFTEPRLKLQTYVYEGRRYFEASLPFLKHVFHVQAGPGIDLSHFRWHTEDDLKIAFARAGFDLQLERHGRSLRGRAIAPKP